MTFLVLPYPGIDPVAFSVGPVSIKWYGLAYMTGLLFAWWYIRRLVSTPRLWLNDKPALSAAQVEDLLIWMAVAVIGGGRLGQVLLYDPGFYFADPLEILKVWKGGMSFHGALLASAVGIVLFARHFKVCALSVMDLCCAAVPVGIFLGRVANFINSEHWGRPTDAAWAMVFPNGGPEPRHPSQLYEALLEGLALFLILRIVTHSSIAGLKRPGLVAGVWLVWYGLSRFLVEFFREPEIGHALNIGPFTAGQIYSIPMLLLGAYLIARARRVEATA